ncbi:MAG: hypothetical protein WBC06_09760, partial [Chitinophagaceae bacterium]
MISKLLIPRHLIFGRKKVRKTGGLFKSSVKANNKELTSKELLSDNYRYFNPNPVGVLASSKNYQ